MCLNENQFGIAFVDDVGTYGGTQGHEQYHDHHLHLRQFQLLLSHAFPSHDEMLMDTQETMGNFAK